VSKSLFISIDILNITPEQLIIKVYDFAILNCQKHNLVKTNYALQELINALNFEDPAMKEISVGLFRLYLYCQDKMRKKEYEVVEKVLTELKKSWESALNRNGI